MVHIYYKGEGCCRSLWAESRIALPVCDAVELLALPRGWIYSLGCRVVLVKLSWGLSPELSSKGVPLFSSVLPLRAVIYNEVPVILVHQNKNCVTVTWDRERAVRFKYLYCSFFKC